MCTFVCFVRDVEVVVMVTERALLTSAFREAEEDVVVMAVVEEEEEGGRAVDCLVGRGSEVEAVVMVVVLGWSLGGALLRSVGFSFPMDPPPFCDGLCLTTFNSSIWVSAVPWARPKSTRAYLYTNTHFKTG